MPLWMQINAKRTSVDKNVEAYFHPKEAQVEKSVYSFMHTRHNVMTKEMAEKSNSQATMKGIYRIYQWDENIKNQSYDRVSVTGKIGSQY